MPKLTDVSIRAARLPESGTVTHWDSDLKGFGLRISAGGAKTFIVLIGSGRRQKIGRYPTLSLASARAEAKRVLAEKTLGKIKPAHVAYEDARTTFLKECAAKLRQLSLKLYTRHLKVHYPFGRTGVADITPAAILKRLNQLNDRPSEKEHAFRIGRTFFKWCVAQHLIDRSPMERLATPANGKSRERVLTTRELTAVYRTALGGSTSFHHLVALLILTGQRRGELTRIKRTWIGDATVTLPGEVTKNGREHSFPLGEKAKAIIAAIPEVKDNPYLFPSARAHVRGKPSTTMTGFSERKRDFDEECRVSGWVLHDLRRTFATGLQQLGIRLEVTEALLNHVSGSRSGVVGIYQRYNWTAEMAAAVEAWESYLTKLLETA